MRPHPLVPSFGMSFFCYLTSSSVMRRHVSGEQRCPPYLLGVAASNLIGYGA